MPIIDNPGDGDCGFYALAIGLINIIQEEYKQDKQGSKIFNKWIKEGLDGVNLQSITDIDLSKPHTSLSDYEKHLLFKLQMSLRNIAVNAAEQDLFSKINSEQASGEALTKIEGSIIYNKFNELIQFYITNNGTLEEIREFNELALSSKVLELAQDTAASLRIKFQAFEEQVKSEKLSDKKAFIKKEAIERDHVKTAFLKDVMLDKQKNPNSVILEGAEEIKEQGRWATHSDLKEIADLLETNLVVVGENNGKPLSGLPTITLKHNGSDHWKTVVNEENEENVKSKQKDTSAQGKASKITLSKEAERVIAATIDPQDKINKKIELYKKHLEDLIAAYSVKDSLFSKVANRIDVKTIDTATANEGESDEDFAVRLQEAEFRGVKL